VKPKSVAARWQVQATAAYATPWRYRQMPSVQLPSEQLKLQQGLPINPHCRQMRLASQLCWIAQAPCGQQDSPSNPHCWQNPFALQKVKITEQLLGSFGSDVQHGWPASPQPWQVPVSSQKVKTPQVSSGGQQGSS
jgi:hypothetical protein